MADMEKTYDDLIIINLYISKYLIIDKIVKQTFITQCSVDEYPNLSMSCRVVF